MLNGQYNTQATGNPYQGATTNVGTNQFSGSNPYLQQMIDKSGGDITKQYNTNVAPSLAAQFSQGGAFGGSAMQSAVSDSQKQLADSLASNSNNYRFQDYTTQQGLQEDALNRSVQAQQTDLARNSALSQQGFENQLAANNQNASNILNASTGINGANALQAQFLGQYAGLAGQQQATQQQDLDQAYQDWYTQNYGYDQQRLNNVGQALNATSGNFQSSATTGPNPAYKAKTAGGALASAAGGAAAGSAFGPWGTAIGGVLGAGSYYL